MRVDVMAADVREELNDTLHAAGIPNRQNAPRALTI
jgi:hypothetical protein